MHSSAILPSRHIVFLWPNAVPYMLRVYQHLADMGYQITVYNSADDPDAPCSFDNYPGVEYRSSVNLSVNQLSEAVIALSPAAVVTSGWYNRVYKRVCRRCRKLGIPTICKIDTQFLHTMRQRIGWLVSPFFIKPAFSHVLVPGVRQYYFVRRMGYDRRHILLYGLSGDNDIFNSVANPGPIAKRFVFVGRLIDVKGLDLLVEAWHRISDKAGWSLHIIGSGPQRDSLRLDSDPEIVFHEYMQQPRLTEYLRGGGVMVMPSTYEAWGVAIHEMTCAAMPLLCSEACGAVPHLLINGYNGYTFRPGDVDDLENRLRLFMAIDQPSLQQMATNSLKLSTQYNPEFTAASIASILR